MKQTLVLSIIALSLCGLSCSPKSSGPLATNGKYLMAAPKDGTSPIPSQLTRYRGQTEFLTPQASSGGLESARASAPVNASSPAGSGDLRAEQESDVFKVGKPGTKLLYLLNNYRGLQVVSYQDGVASPKLLGRTESTGNYPSDMYMDPKQDRLFVLERVWLDSSSTYTQNRSRILVYDVSNPAAPKVADTIDIKGEIVDSRMVGEVLYIISTLRPDTNSWDYRIGKSSQSQGIVTSFNMSGRTVSPIQEMTLTLPAVYGNNLRVVTVPKDDSYKYYLLASLSENGWGWWGRQSMVQVVDISDDKGQISPVMTVSVKGTISRPHQMQIKNNTLIVVSNYVVPGQTSAPSPGQPSTGTPRVGRIAVETFKFPMVTSEIVSEDEAELRRLYIDKQVKLETAKGIDAEASRTKWASDTSWGMHGRFVKTSDQLRKLTPDSVVTTGDTTGQSATLQDVRIYGDWLYAFWVPTNQVDPLDLFDISSPENGIKHIQRLTFDGWISRAEPIQFNGKNYVIGLGWIVPAVNNENNKRYAMVKLFEVTPGKKVPTTEVASLVLTQSQFWANFNGQDKLIEFKQTSPGTGEILFEGTRYSNMSYDDGGQLITFDLSQHNSENIFKEGSFLSGNSSWIKRIFTNTEIDRINSFSDASLVTFSSSQSATVKAAHVLELARNIRSFITIGDQGVQVITEGNAWGTDESSKVILRAVPKNRVDAEKTEALSEIIIPGTYSNHRVSADTSSVIIITTKTVHADPAKFNYTTWYQAHQVSLAKNGTFNIASSEAWMASESTTNGQGRLVMSTSMSLRSSRYPSWYGSEATVFTLPTGDVIVSVGGELKRIAISNNNAISTQSVSLNSCGLSKKSQSEIKQLGDQLYLIRKTPVDIKSFYKSYSQATKNDLIPLTWDKVNFICGQAINIPGTVVAFDGQVMIVDDTWVHDVYQLESSSDRPNEKPDRLSLSTGLTSLKVVKTDFGTQAILVDGVMMTTGESSGYLVAPKSFANTVTLVKYSGQNSNTYQPAKLQMITADKNAQLSQNDFIMPDAIEYGNLTSFFQSPTHPQVLYGIIQGWRQMQVVQLSADGARPELVPLVLVDYKNQKQNAVKTVNVVGYNSYDEGTINYSADQHSLEVAAGMYGVKQIFLQR